MCISYLTKMTEVHLKNRQVQYTVSSNDKAQFSNEQDIFNSHKEVTTLVIHKLEQMEPITCNVSAHATDHYVFFFIVETIQGGIMPQPLDFTGAWAS